MAADFNKPTVDDPSYINVLPSIREQFKVVSTMSYGNAVSASLPTGAVQFLDGRLQKWNGSAFINVPIGLTGGGTGASTAGGARIALNVPEAGTASNQVRTNAQSDALYVPTSREITTSGALTGGGAMNGDVDISIPDASTSAKGAVQLYNGLNSTSTSLALTAAQGKVLAESSIYYNSATLPAPSGEFTGGSCKVVRVGDVVTITGKFTHSSDSGVFSASGFIPSWARSGRTGSVTLHYSTGSNLGIVTVGGLNDSYLGFFYENNSGSALSRTDTDNFTISYTV